MHTCLFLIIPDASEELAGWLGKARSYLVEAFGLNELAGAVQWILEPLSDG